jgi:RNA recognition motif-containing protein
MTNIFVGNLPFTACDVDLKRAFERYGRVASVQVMTDQSTNRSRGFAFVRMPFLDDAEEAIKCMAGTLMGGRQLTVNESKNDRRSAPGQGRDHSARDSARDMFSTLLGE